MPRRASGTPGLVLLPDPVAAGDLVRLDADESRYVARVCRVRPGEHVRATDGRGRSLELVVEAVGTTVSARVESIEVVDRGRRAWVIAGAPERGREDVMIEKLAELGIERWTPVQSEAGAWEASRSRPARWSRIAVAALRQSLSCHLMTVGEPIGLEEAIASVPRDAARWVGSQEGAACSEARTAELEVAAIGPAGGFSASETRTLEAAGFAPIRLASRRLRTETAAIAWAAWWASRP